MKIAFLPIDNRPVCYTLPKCIAQIDDDIEFYLPERELLGDLEKSADIEGLFAWLRGLPNLDAMVLSLDTIAYGGLIPSRRCPESFEEIAKRLEILKELLRSKKSKIYAFSSIMRISNNNYNQEEKEYWSEYGKKIFEYSYNLHKYGDKKVVQTELPQEILEDYLSTRNRNFEVNKKYLEWKKEGLFETLVFSKDDCAQYGLNVQEATLLEELGGFTKTGADEIPLSLLARAVSGVVKVCPIFLEPECVDLISNYEDVSIKDSVLGQLELAGCKVSSEDEADILLYINNFKEKQGEIVMKVDTENFNGNFVAPNSAYMIADVRFANGADNKFVESFFKNKDITEKFYGYSAWNTSANSLGSLICGAKVKFFAKKYNKKAFTELLLTRFLDDWAYQANLRQKLSSPDVESLNTGMKVFEDVIKKVFGVEFSAKYSYPWKRLFEVEVEFS